MTYATNIRAAVTTCLCGVQVTRQQMLRRLVTYDAETGAYHEECAPSPLPAWVDPAIVQRAKVHDARTTRASRPLRRQPQPRREPPKYEDEI